MVTVSMEELPVVVAIFTTAYFGVNVVYFQLVFHPEIQSTLSTFALLPLEQGRYLIWQAGLSPSSCCPVNPVAIVRTFVSTHFDMPLDSSFPMSNERGVVFGREVPMACFQTPVFVDNPFSGFR